MVVEDILTVDGSLWTNMGRCYTQKSYYIREIDKAAIYYLQQHIWNHQSDKTCINYLNRT
jgi:hypothetical protein